MKREKIVFSLLCLAICLLFLPLASYGDTSSNSPANVSQTATAAEANSDAALVSEAEQLSRTREPFMSKWLHMLDKQENGDADSISVMAYGPQVPGDLARVLAMADKDKKTAGLFGVLFRTIVAIGLGFLAVFIFNRFARKGMSQIEHLKPPDEENLARFWANILNNIPALANLLVLAISATLIFLLLAGNVTIKGRMLFQLILGIVLIFKAGQLLSRIVFAPQDKALRLFEIDESLVKPLYHALLTSSVVLLSGLLFMRLIRELGAQPQTVAWVAALLGSAVLAVFAYLVIYLKSPVKQVLQSANQGKSVSWLKSQLATYWHIPVLLYLFFIWFIWIGQIMTGSAAQRGEFVISLIIIPLYFLLSYAGRLVISSVVDSLGLGQKTIDDPFSKQEEVVDEEEAAANKQAIISKTHLFFRLLLAIALFTWLLSLYGYRIPFATTAVKAIFDSLVIVALALFFWRFASSYIERKIEEATPDVPEQQEDEDNEFGSGAPKGRSHTLLPMLRKVVGSIIIVMVVLTVLSSLGVNIGPILAGAGVLGLAVGFGAQKLVSDVLSGFFFLLDDAFRVGEYIQTGSIRGTVESITLRNVMLRHHRGMLQVVPHSDLGAVTNYMRGGIVIKFPLEFPYDTNIDQVRKIIKKVGVAMLADEELGDDFMQPVKSQGVNEITNSVMVIRVKFTAKPGKQFV
ncbi:MAG: mechanosensitive ion channel, partial [Deltaproteobacteria bacterium]|nr:mechanosensitive ion channel [Deltaproteobacteria bacterium]